jgi:hypothetical protein
MNKTKYILIIVIGLLVSLYFIYKDHLPPRSPYKVARIVSELKIPKSSELIRFEENWNSFQGDGYSFIELSISESVYQKIEKVVLNKGYIKLPIKEAVKKSITDSNLYVYLKEFPENGFFRLKQHNDNSFDLVVLDTDTKKLYIYISVM